MQNKKVQINVSSVQKESEEREIRLLLPADPAPGGRRKRMAWVGAA